MYQTPSAHAGTEGAFCEKRGVKLSARMYQTPPAHAGTEGTFCETWKVSQIQRQLIAKYVQGHSRHMEKAIAASRKLNGKYIQGLKPDLPHGSLHDPLPPVLQVLVLGQGLDLILANLPLKFPSSSSSSRSSFVVDWRFLSSTSCSNCTAHSSNGSTPHSASRSHARLCSAAASRKKR